MVSRVQVAVGSAVVVIFACCSAPLLAQAEALRDAPRHFRFYANQLQSQFERVKTLKGTLSSALRSPVKEAVFYHDRGDQRGIDEVRIVGDFIRENRGVFDFTWDLQSDNVVSIGRPLDNPCRFFYRDSDKELVPEQKNCVVGAERKVLIDSAHKITTSNFRRDQSSGHQVYDRSQIANPEMEGSAKQLFYWTADLTFHEFLFAVAEQLEKEGESAGMCYLDIQEERHKLELVANSKSGHPLTYKWVFDVARDFSLALYECQVGEKGITTTCTWTYDQVDSFDSIPVLMESKVVQNGELSSIAIHKLSKLVVNEQFPADAFSLAALGPTNGDMVIDSETGKKFFVQDTGETLVSADLYESESKGNFRILLIINVGVIAVLSVLVILRRQARRMPAA